MFEPSIPDPVEAPPADDAVQPDPYDGVALGVECAWPIETSS